MPLSTNKIKGKIGEDIAAHYLNLHGFKIFTRNWYCNHGELDIVSTFQRQLIFTEVKLVTKYSAILPTDLYNYKKKRHLLRTIGIFLNKLKKNYNWRLDLICITLDGKKAWVEHFINLGQ